MELASRKLLTVVTEAALERRLIEDLHELGVWGYTIVPARGAGERGERAADWEQARSLKIEIVCEAAVAEKVARHVHDSYFRDYAVVLWLADVEVLRPDKFTVERRM
jgi:nitrogen regulatory protein PII